MDQKLKNLKRECARLFSAIKKNDIKTVRSEFSKNPELTWAEDGHHSPLSKAATLGHYDIVKLLLERKTGINERYIVAENNKWCLLFHLMSAECNPCTENHVKVGELLIQHGANVNSVDSCKKTPLLHAVENGNVGWVEFLLKNGAWLKCLLGKTDNVNPVAHICNGNSSTEYRRDMLKLLVKYGLRADDFKTKSGMNLLHLIIDADCDTAAEVAAFLISLGVSVNECDKQGRSPLTMAIKGGDVRLTSILVNSYYQNGKTPLQCAIENGDVASARLLLENGAKLDRIKWNSEILEFYIYKKSNIRSRNDMLTLLLKHGLDPRFQDKNGKTHLLSENLKRSKMLKDKADHDGNLPLHDFVLEKNTESMTLLVSEGANVNIKNKKKNTPLHLAVKDKDPSEAIIDLLLSHGADVNAKNEDEQTSIHIACGRHDRRENIINLLVCEKADVNVRDADGKTALHIACSHGCSEKLISLLIRNGADMNIGDKYAETPLHIVCRNYDWSEKIISLMIDSGADVNAKDEYGETALHKACNILRDKVIRLLIRKGADISAKDNNGKTPFFLLFRSNQCKNPDVSIGVFVKEFSRLRLENIPIDEKDMNLIQTQPKTREYFEKCLIELPQLSKVKFYSHYSFYTILMFSNIKKLAKLTRNKGFLSNFHGKVQTFSCFKEDLIKILYEAKKVRDEIEDVYSRLKSIFRDYLPDIVLRKLSDDLVPDDLPVN